MFLKQERPEMDDFEEEKNVGPFHYFKVNYKAPEKKKWVNVTKSVNLFQHRL